MQIPFRSTMYPYSPQGQLGLFFVGNYDYWESATRIKITGNPRVYVNGEFDIESIQFMTNGNSIDPDYTVAVYTTKVFSQSEVSSYNNMSFGANGKRSGFIVEKVGGGAGGVELVDIDYSSGEPIISHHPNASLPPRNSGGGGSGSGSGGGSNDIPDPTVENYRAPISEPRIPMEFIVAAIIILLTANYWIKK